MENNKTCHLYTYIFLLVLSFFLFSYNVNAVTQEVYFSNSDISYYDSIDFNNIMTSINSYILEHPTYNYYFCRKRNNDNSYINCYLSENIPSFTYDTVGLEKYLYFQNLTAVNISFSSFGSTLVSSIYGSYSPYLYFTWSYNSSTSEYFTTYATSNRETFVYSNFNLLVTSFNGPSLNIHSNNTSYLFENNTNFPSLYFIYNNGLVSDNTPILTDFYTLIIDKFSVIADFFVDNTYLFAIPLIPIFILCIYLIKRSLIK